MFHKKAIKILHSTIGVESNRKELLPSFPLKIEVKSLLSDFNCVEEIDSSSQLDGYISIVDSGGKPFYKFQGTEVSFRGPFVKLTDEASDLRFSLWGNQGFLYRYTLYLLEKNHKIYNLHACALYEEEKDALYLIIGGAGSGKTVYLLSAFAYGLKLFSTETVHFQIQHGNLTWFMGSLVDNVRFGTLMFDFPQFLPDVRSPLPEEMWLKKVALDLSSYQTEFKKLRNPRSVYILFPRIEEGRKGFLLNRIKDKRQAAKALFDNISQKLTETVILYDKMPVLGIDEPKMALRRLEQVDRLMMHESIVETASVLSNPKECWGELLKQPEKGEKNE